MKKWGFWLVLLFLLPNVCYAYNYNKTLSNPYMIFGYKLTNTTTNVVWTDTDYTSRVYSVNYNAYSDYKFDGYIDFVSNLSNINLDMGDASLFQNNDTDIKYILLPMCVSKYDFDIQVYTGGCGPSCLNENLSASVLFDTDNSCQLVNDEEMIGPVQYLKDPSKGTRVWITLSVKSWYVTQDLLHGSVNDYIRIKNVRSDSTFYYRWLNADTNEGGLYDRDGINAFSLKTNSREVAIIQNENVNSPYRCQMSYNKLDISQGSYFNNDILTLSSSSLPLIRNLDSTNIFDNNSDFYSSGATSTSIDKGIRVTTSVQGQYKFVAYKLGGSNLLGKTITFHTKFNRSGSNNGLVSIFQGTSTYPPINSISNSAIYDTGTKTVSLPNTFTGNNDTFWILFYSNVNGDNNIGNYIDYTDLQVEIGNKYTGYIPYSVYGFNNDVSYSNYPSFLFTDSNLKQSGKVQVVIEYQDNFTNQYNYKSQDLVLDIHDLLGNYNRSSYRNNFWIYNECLYGFGYLCGDKIPKRIQFQLLDVENEYYFEDPLLYYTDANYSKITGNVNRNSYDYPAYVPPNKLICNDENSGVMYNYEDKTVIYDKTSDDYTSNQSFVNQSIAQSLFSDYDLPNQFGLSSLLTIPINTINTIRDGQCTPIDINFNIKGQNVTAMSLPCGSTFYERSDMLQFKPWLVTFFTGYTVITLGYTLLRFIIKNRNLGHLQPSSEVIDL